MKKNKAFTLAEVLLTLVIIGVISAVTLPIIKKVSDEHAYVAGVKKAYMTLSTVVSEIKNEEGPIRTFDKAQMMSAMKKKMNVSAENFDATYSKKYLNGESLPTTYDTYFRSTNSFQTTDGVVWSFGASKPKTCDLTSGNLQKKGCFDIYVDINGKSLPNTIGVDIYVFSIQPDGVHPFGGDSCKSNSKGWSCAERVITEGKISW